MSMISKADIHIHTTYSCGSMTPNDLIEHVYHYSDLRLIAITDHDTIQGGLDVRAYLNKKPHYRTRFDVIVGAEVKSAEGHILGLFLTKDVKPSQSAFNTIQAIHQQGGIAVAAHPFSHWLAWLGMRGVGSLIRTLNFDAVETRNSSITEIYSNYLVQFLNRRWQNLPNVGGSDGYIKTMLGKTYTMFQGHTPEDFYVAVKKRNTRAGGFVCSSLTMLNLFRHRSPNSKHK